MNIGKLTWNLQTQCALSSLDDITNLCGQVVYQRLRILYIFKAVVLFIIFIIYFFLNLPLNLTVLFFFLFSSFVCLFWFVYFCIFWMIFLSEKKFILLILFLSVSLNSRNCPRSLQFSVVIFYGSLHLYMSTTQIFLDNFKSSLCRSWISIHLLLTSSGWPECISSKYLLPKVSESFHCYAFYFKLYACQLGR